MTNRARIFITDLNGLTHEEVLHQLRDMGHYNYPDPAEAGRVAGYSGIGIQDLLSKDAHCFSVVTYQDHSVWADYTMTGEQWRQFVSLRLEQIQERDGGQWEELDDDDYEIEW